MRLARVGDAVRGHSHRCAPCSPAFRPRVLDVRCSSQDKPRDDLVDMSGPKTTLVGRQSVLRSCTALGCLCSLPSYQDYFAWVISHGMDTYEKAIAPVKEKVFTEFFQPGPRPMQRILEIGIGAAANASFYASLGQGVKEVVGLDPNPKMQPYARERWAKAGLPLGASSYTPDGGGSSDGGSGSGSGGGLGQVQGGPVLTLVEGSASELPFAAEEFDAAVCTLVLCSVPDVPAALQELRRVLKPGAPLLIIEHVKSEGGLTLVAQKVLDPLQRALADGCHLTRDTYATVSSAGYGMQRVSKIQVDGLLMFAPHMAGVAEVKAA